MRNRRKLSYERKKARYGYLFISLWLIGFILLFLIPFITSIVYSFSSVDIKPGLVVLKPVGFQNYFRAFKLDADFMPIFTGSISSIVFQTPLIVMFSLFIGVLLNQKFRGRLFARAVFFLPVIITSGVVISIINSDSFLTILMSGGRSSMMLESATTQEILSKLQINPLIVNYISSIVNQIFNLSWRSGIQILIFLSGLQAIPTTFYEVSKVEGATAWETFWKITFPMITPTILVNVIYTLIDNFISYDNPMFAKIQATMGKIDFAYASAMSVVNFVVLFVLIGVVYFFINRKIYYVVD